MALSHVVLDVIMWEKKLFFKGFVIIVYCINFVEHKKYILKNVRNTVFHAVRSKMSFFKLETLLHGKVTSTILL